MAQEQSVRISVSYSVYSTLQIGSIAFFTNSKEGNGFPLHKLESAHEPCFIVFRSCVFIIILTKGFKPSHFKIMSLYVLQSPEILPIAQIAYSLMSVNWECNSLQNKGIAPLSIIDYV